MAGFPALRPKCQGPLVCVCAFMFLFGCLCADSPPYALGVSLGQRAENLKRGNDDSAIKFNQYTLPVNMGADFIFQVIQIHVIFNA
jgi:hypothetical protein